MDGTIRSADEHPVRFDLLTENPVYKPFRYPWAYEAWLTQQRVHWLPEEVPLADDVKDWHRNLSAGRAQPADADLPLLHPGRRRGEQLLHEALRAGVQTHRSADDAVGVLQHRDGAHRRLQPSARHDRHAGTRVPGVPQIQGDEGQVRFHAELHGGLAVRDRQDACRVRRVHRGPAVVRVIRHPAELPAVREDEGDGPDHHPGRCATSRCTAIRSSGCSAPSCRKIRRSGPRT